MVLILIKNKIVLELSYYSTFFCTQYLFNFNSIRKKLNKTREIVTAPGIGNLCATPEVIAVTCNTIILNS